jgi:hypothetical protein
MKQKRPESSRKRGPEPERVKIKGDWREAMAEAVKKPPMPKKRPKKGWPKT